MWMNLGKESRKLEFTLYSKIAENMSVDYNINFVKVIKARIQELTDLMNEWEVERFLSGEVIFDEETLILEVHAAKYLEVDPKTLYRLRVKGVLSYTKNGRGVLYAIKDLREMLADGYVPSTKKTIEDVMLGHCKYVKKRDGIKADK